MCPIEQDGAGSRTHSNQEKIGACTGPSKANIKEGSEGSRFIVVILHEDHGAVDVVLGHRLMVSSWVACDQQMRLTEGSRDLIGEGSRGEPSSYEGAVDVPGGGNILETRDSSEM